MLEVSNIKSYRNNIRKVYILRVLNFFKQNKNIIEVIITENTESQFDI